MIRVVASPGDGFADLEWTVAILTVDQLRLHITTALSDAALQRLLDAAEQAIVNYAGSPGDVTELIDGGNRRIALTRQAVTITSITETPYSGPPVTLAADDYRIRAEGYVLERLHTGTNPRSWFHGLVTVIYAASSQDALRELVQIELVKLDVFLDPALRSHSIGDFSETFSADKSPDQLRDEILARLTPEPGGIRVVGTPTYYPWASTWGTTPW